MNRCFVYSILFALLVLSESVVVMNTSVEQKSETSHNESVSALTSMNSSFTDQDELINDEKSSYSIKEGLEQWVEAESMHITYAFATSYIEHFDIYSYISAYYPAPISSGAAVDVSLTHEDDGLYWSLYSVDDPNFEGNGNEYAGLCYYLDIPAKTGGTLYYEMKVLVWDNSHTYEDNICNMDGSYSFIEDDLSASGYLQLAGSAITRINSAGTKYAYCQIVKNSGDERIFIEGNEGSFSKTSIHSVELRIDELRFVRDEIESDIRSQRRYVTADSTEYRLEIQNFEYGTEIQVCNPNYLMFGSITPTASISESSNIVISETIPVLYELRLISNYSRQFMAIEDKSFDYLKDIGFEGSWSNDWKLVNDFDSKILNSTIVYEGVYSLRLEDTDGSSDFLMLSDMFPSGEFYISFAYYVETAPTTLQFNYYDETIHTNSLDVSTTDRWIQDFYFIHLDDESLGYGEIRFGFSLSQAIVFFDDFRIWQVNHQVKTSAYEEIIVSGTLINLDCLVNPCVSFETINLALYDRTADSMICETNQTTDSSGNFEWIVDTLKYSELQDQREIEVRSWSYDSFFGYQNYEYFENLARVEVENEISSSEAIEDNALKFEVYDTNWFDIKFQPDENIDLTQFDYFSFKVKANESSTANTDLYNMLWTCPSSGNWYYIATDYAYYTYYRTVNYNLDDLEIYAGSPNASDCDYFMLYFNEAGGGISVTIYIDEMKYIQAQKSYYTAINVSDFVYYYEKENEGFTKDNEWDFSEQTVENWVENSDATSPQAIDGYISNILTDEYDGVKYDDFTGVGSEYSKLIVRMKANTSFNGIISLVDGSNQYFYPSLTSSWEVFTYSINFVGDTDDYVYIAENTGESTSAVLYIDFVRLVKRDESILSLTDSYAYLSSVNNSYQYRVEIDDSLQGYYSDLSAIPLNLSVGLHTINATPFCDMNRELVFFSSESIVESYSGNDLCSIIIVDQQNNFLEPRQFKIYIDSSRIYSDTFLWLGTGNIKNITIVDMFDNQLYQDTAVEYSRFVDIVLTLYSLKIQNLQPDPTWICLQRGSKNYSEWVFAYEVVHYRLETDMYNLTVFYSSYTGNLGNANTNGTTASYEWSVTSDNAIIISGRTIADVFGNTQDILGDLETVNSTIHSQILNINLSLSNQNTAIGNQIVNVNIELDNVNSSIQSELTNIDTAIANLDSFVNVQFTDINTTLLNINNTVLSQTNLLLSNLSNVNSTIYAQTLSILSIIQNVNVSIFDQTVSILSDLANTNVTLFTQGLNIISRVTNVNSSIISQLLSLYTAIEQIEPADPNIEINATATINDTNIDEAINFQSEQISFWGTVSVLGFFVVFVLVFIALFRPTDYQKLAKKLNYSKLAEKAEELQKMKWLD